MIEHEPWRGPNRESGIEGQRIAIVGYSHYRDARDPDCNQFTNNVVKAVISRKKIYDSLFPRVPGYFGYKDRAEFWKCVWFFNFIPECIGTNDQKYATAEGHLVERAKNRFKDILRQEKPHIEKVFVFSTKAWPKCPFTVEEENDEDCTPLGVGFDGFSWGRYVFSDHTVTAFGLRHPQFAKKVHMTAAVKKALSIS
jgi:hypothetical protein